MAAQALLAELREGRRLLGAQTLELDALRASERRLRLIADHLPAFVAYVGATDLRYTWVNDRFVSGFGRPRVELIGSLVRDVIGARNFEFALPFIEQVRAGRAVSYENDFSLEQGARCIQVNYVPDVAEDGAVIGIIVLSYDVTEVTRATAALRESEQRLRTLFEQAAVGVAEIDSTTGRFLRINQKYCDIVGYSKADAEHLDFQTITHPDDLAHDLAQMERLKAGAIREYRVEKRYLRRDGSVIWVNLTVSPMWSPGEPPTHHIAVVEDITSRREAEEGLRLNRELLRAATRIARVGGWELDLPTMKLSWSEEVFRIHEREASSAPTVEEAIGYYAPEHVPLIRRAVTEAIDEGKPFDLELAISTALGRRREVRAKGEAEVRDGKTIKVWGTFQDVTEQKRVEAALASTQRLESLGTLAGGIAHDFNNILTSIVGNLSLLEHGVVGEDAQVLREAQAACDVARGLSAQLLTFARGGSPVVEVVDLRTVLTRAASFGARGSSARCAFALSDAPLWVRADPEQVAQVVQNLVLNGAQAMPEGGAITISAKTVDLTEHERPPLPAGRYVQVTFEDEGPGIPASSLPRIFDPYFSTKAQGRGLGLAVCYSIMAKHGGMISAQSPPGRGASFTLLFPSAPSEPTPLAAPAPELSLGCARVLLMDDDEAVALVGRRMLERLGYSVESVADGRAALEAYQAAQAEGRPFEVVVMDLTIPGGMGGVEAVRRLKELDPAAIAVVSSGYSNDPVMADFAAHGFSGVLRKPYRLAEVSAVLRSLVEGSPPSR